MNSLTPAQQMIYIKKMYNIDKTTFYSGYMIIEMHIKPTELSREYPMRIKYYYSGKVDVWITGNLEKLDAPNFPHVYDIDKERGRVEVCLYLPGNNEWDKNKFIAETIIPWVSEWLYHYELWLATGIWSGGGKHPNNVKR